MLTDPCKQPNPGLSQTPLRCSRVSCTTVYIFKPKFRLGHPGFNFNIKTCAGRITVLMYTFIWSWKIASLLHNCWPLQEEYTSQMYSMRITCLSPDNCCMRSTHHRCRAWALHAYLQTIFTWGVRIADVEREHYMPISWWLLHEEYTSQTQNVSIICLSLENQAHTHQHGRNADASSATRHSHQRLCFSHNISYVNPEST